MPLRFSAHHLSAVAPKGPVLAGAALLGLGVALAGCSAQSNRYTAMGDSRPHPGVARAHTLPVHGIDVSKWQGRIDWAAARAAGTRFAFIKATEGGDHLDDRFHENWAAAREAGVARGAYHFTYWCRPAHEQAAWFRRNVPADPDALPPVLDLEWNNQSRNCPQKVSREVALANIRILLKEMEAHTGKRPIIYTDINFHADILVDQLHDYSIWLRSTADEPHARYHNRRWMMWQYTTTGRVPGIRGAVDRNAFYGTEAEWAHFAATGCEPRLHHHLEAHGLCGARTVRVAGAN